MRITGLATGLDMDEIVKANMQPYRIRIQQQQQKKEILEIKQKLYRDVVKDCREFYNKYFDVSKSDSILLSKNWITQKFQSSNENAVTITASTDARVGNYTVEGKPATAAKATVENIDAITINGKEFATTGTNAKDKVTDLNKQLKEAGINVTVRYTDFTGTDKPGFILESTVLGKDGTFTVGGTQSTFDKNIISGIDKAGATATHNGFTVENLKANGLSVAGKVINIFEDMTTEDMDKLNNSDIQNLINSKIKDTGLTSTIDEDGKITFTTIELGSKVAGVDIAIGSATVAGGSFQPGIDETYTINTVTGVDVKGIIVINGVAIDLTKAEGGTTATDDQKVEYINSVLKEQKVGVTATTNGSNIIFTSDKAGSSYNVDVNTINGNTLVTEGRDAEITITDDKGGVYTHNSNSNSVTLDGVTFNFGVGLKEGEKVTIIGKNDVTDIKDKLVTFINDYNKVIEKLNTLTMEKKSSGYSPLTDEQKKEMSEDEIKLWNEKVEKGQLSRDTDLTRIANSMKSAMSSLIGGSNLEKFGIKPVSDYQGTKNGTFTIDDAKLTEALENNTEEIMNLFIGTNEDKNKNGVAQKLKTILYDETVTVSAALIKKAGIEGSATTSNNELTKKIEIYNRKMQDMETDFSRREQALYSKWAKIESMMNSLNSQQSYLYSQLGM